jgi:endonuclease YncB( thermonuclease family)
MPVRALTPTPRTYAQLRKAVVAVVIKGRREIDRAWIETYHETGRLINEHILLVRERADYGARTYEKLVADTGISERVLRQCSQFHRAYPIWNARSELSWGHYRLLIQVEDDARRKAIEAEAIRQHWTTRELETRVRSFNAIALASDDAAPAKPVGLLTPRRGTPGLHPIVDRGSGPEVDLGFKFYRELGPASKLTTKDIVRLTEDGVRKIDDATKADLFTYAATVRKVVDGDTLVVALAVAPGFTHELKLRLRGLDCPEMATAAGRAAKTFVDDLLHAGDEVIMSTTKPDKYDRYLADVFIANAQAATSSSEPRADGSKLKADGMELFLNNALLQAGHAVPYDGVGPKDEAR